MPRLPERYKKEVIPGLKESFGYRNIMAIPKIEKVVVNIGFGRKVAGKTPKERDKIADVIIEELGLITGQRALKTAARKSISGFKVRAGMPVGAKVTLRGQRMYDFLDRLVDLVLPRTRDFQGISPNSIDKGGNLTIAIQEHISFPEISPEKVKEILSLEVTVVTTAKSREEGLELFRLLGFPIKN